MHLWLLNHSFSPVDSTVLVELARTLPFENDERLDPTAGMAQFMPVWAQSLGAEAEIPNVKVHRHFRTALGIAALSKGGNYIKTAIKGVPMEWTAFAYDWTTA